MKVRFKSTTLDQFIERYSVDISRGGMFIRTREPLAVGTAVRFEFTLDDSSPVLSGEATVVWRREHDPQRPGAPAGMGVKFDVLTTESKGVLDRILEAKKRLDTGQPIGASQPIAIPSSSSLMDEDDQLHQQPTKIAPLSELMGDAADDALSPSDRTVVAPAKSAELARRTLDGLSPLPPIGGPVTSSPRATGNGTQAVAPPPLPPPLPAYDRAELPPLPPDIANTGSDEIKTMAAVLATPPQPPAYEPPAGYVPPSFAQPSFAPPSFAPQPSQPGASLSGASHLGPGASHSGASHGYPGSGQSQPGLYQQVVPPGASQHGGHVDVSQHGGYPGASQPGAYHPGASQPGAYPGAEHGYAPPATDPSAGQDPARMTAGFGFSTAPFAQGTGPGTSLDSIGSGLAIPKRSVWILGLLGGAALITAGIALVVHGGRGDPKPLSTITNSMAAGDKEDDTIPEKVEPIRPLVPRTGPVDLEVITHPEGAQLHIDGQPFDQPTPTILRGLDPKRTLKLVAVHECYEPAALEVTPDPSHPVEIALKPRRYVLAVTTTPPGAIVRVEGRELGASPQQATLGKGELDHPLLVTVSRSGFQEKSVSFDPRPSCKEGGGKLHVTLKR